MNITELFVMFPSCFLEEHRRHNFECYHIVLFRVLRSLIVGNSVEKTYLYNIFIIFLHRFQPVFILPITSRWYMHVGHSELGS